MDKYIYMIIDDEETCSYDNFRYFYTTTILDDFLEKLTHLPLFSDVDIIIMMNHETNDPKKLNNIIFIKNLFYTNYYDIKDKLYNLSKSISNVEYLSEDIKDDIKRYIDEFILFTNFEELEYNRKLLIGKQDINKINLMKQLAYDYGYEVIKKL